MAHHIEPMDIDSTVCDFDDKENSFHHNNVLPRTPCTEKGYEELDVSELNMKLRYSITPAASPMSKSFTANCLDNPNNETENGNMTQSLHSTLTKNDTILINPKSLPLQILSIDHTQIGDSNRNVLRPLDSTITTDNITVTITGANNVEDNLSLPSSSSSMAHTPEATTPTNEIQKLDEGSPIMRGLKSVLSMFRPSQSPIPPDDEQLKHKALPQSLIPPDDEQMKDEAFSPPIVHSPESLDKAQAMCVSTPLTAHKTKDPLGKSKSPTRDSLVFNEDLEKDLEWKDDSILFGKEKIPIHKLFFQLPKANPALKINGDLEKSMDKSEKPSENMNETVEYMDISCNDTLVMDKTASNIPDMNCSEVTGTDSDGEFVDAESTIKNESHFEQSFKSQQDYESIQETDILCTAEQEKLNVTTETLNANMSKSADLSSASAETIKVIENSFEKSAVMEEVLAQPDIVQKVNEIEGSSSAEIGKLDTIKTDDNMVSVINHVSKNNHNNTIVKESVTAVDDIVKSSLDNINVNIVDNNIKAGLSPVTDNVVVSSLSQIPLIADPRVLLFSVCSDPDQSENVEQDKNIHAIETCLPVEVCTSPADVPLPDDDDIVSLPSMNCTLDNISQALDKISEEIPKINLQAVEQEIMESASSEEKLLDLTLSNFAVSDSQGSPKLLDNREVELKLKESVTLHNEQRSVLNILDEIPVREQIFQSMLVAEKAAINLNDTQAVISAIEELIPASANIDQKPFAPQLVEPINISTAIVPSAYQSKTGDGYVGNRNPCTSEAVDILIQRENETVVKENEKALCVNVHRFESQFSNEAHDVLSNEINDIVSESSTQSKPSAQKVSFLFQEADEEAGSIAPEQKHDRQVIVSNVDFIKQEVEAIIDKAVDIVMENMAASEHTTKTEGLSYTIQNGQVSEVSEKIIKSSLRDLTMSTERLSNTSANICKNTEIQTVIENQKVTCDMNSTDTTKLQNVNIETNSDLTLISVSPTCVSTNEVNCVSTAETIFKDPEFKEVVPDYKPFLDEVKIMDDTPPDMEKIEPNMLDEEIHNITDEKVVVSENNSPFVLVSQDQDIVATALENFKLIEDPLVAQPKVVASPPSSPIIESKGYNFNFDEIVDPFTTKAKIRLSPQPGECPDRIFKQSNDWISSKENDLPKKVTKNARRKSQPEREKSLACNKKLSATFAGKFKTPVKPNAISRSTVAQSIESTVLQFDKKDEPLAEKNSQIKDAPINTIKDAEMPSKENKRSNKEVKNENKEITSLEQSAYFSVSTSSTELVESKNTFNLSDHDKPDANPFATKCKLRQTPSPEDTDINPFATVTKVCQTPPPADIQDLFATSQVGSSTESSIPHNTEITTVNTTVKELSFSNNIESKMDVTIQKSSVEDSENLNSTTSSTKNEKDNSINTVNTEDEDTIEGPFLEVEEFDNVNKVSEFNRENFDMMRFSNITNETEVNTEAGEMFIDAETFEFLLNHQQTNTAIDQYQGKESLFMKFDPLFSRGHPEKKVKKFLPRDATFDIPGPSTINTAQELDVQNATDDSYDDFNVTVSKPMMVVNPAVNAVVTPRNKSLTSVRSNRQSLTFTSPAIAVIDRLLSMSSANNSFMSHDTTVSEFHRDNEADLAVTQLREHLADKEISVYNLRTETKELQNRLETMESQMRNLETIAEQRLKKINDLNERLDEKIKDNNSMAKVVEEYERTIASLITETEQDKLRHAEEKAQLIRERDEQTAHLASMEISFNDLHSKYEKSKQVILGFKSNEDMYKKSLKEFEENVTKIQNNYELLKQHATSKLNYANEELQKINRAHESEVLKLKALIKRKELHITSLEETLQQKTKANEELTAICDELISKVG